jgi:hypothetical protein
VGEPVATGRAASPGRQLTKDARLVLGLVLVPLLLAAAVRLPLFQDGSSYLLELMTSNAAVRHHRHAVLLIQAPSIIGLWLAEAARMDPPAVLRLVGALFNLSYAVVPVIAVAWSWIIVRRRDPALMIWAATPILLLNAVNFSWVSELLLAMQLSCPLMLAAYQSRRTTCDMVTVAILTPIVVMLHALVSVLFIGMAIGMAIRAVRLVALRRSSLMLLGVFLAAAAIRLLLDAWLLTDYERSMLEGPQLTGYFSARIENVAFLVVSAAVTLWFAFSRHPNGSIKALGTAEAGLPSNLHVTRADRTGLILLWIATLAVVAKFMDLPYFPLKTGLTVIIAAVLIGFAAFDSTRNHGTSDVQRRRLLVINAAAIFAIVLISKAAIWHAANTRLNETLTATGKECVEIDDPSLDWLRDSPNTILNNWSLPSLVLVSPPRSNRALLLKAGDCARYTRTGEIVVDPWTVLPRPSLPFVFGEVGL